MCQLFRPFLNAIKALGDAMRHHVTCRYLMIDEMKAALGQIGALRPVQARAATARHPGALHF
jgi:hypothetical protein